MRLPLGFGKKGYFSLVAIQASVSQSSIHAHHTRIFHTTQLLCAKESDEECEDDPPPHLLGLLSLLFCYRPRVCQCNRIFASRAHAAIKHTQKRRKCNCNCPYFSFRRTGIHPPFLPTFLLFFIMVPCPFMAYE